MAECERPLRAAEPCGQLLPRRLSDDPRSGETQQRPWLGHADVGERGEARQYPSGARIGKQRHERRPGLVDQVHRARRLGHLHESESALLHASPARAADRDDGQSVGDGELRAAPEPFADHTAHAAAHEAEVQDGEDTSGALDAGRPHDDGFREACLRLGGANAFRVGLQVHELQRVERRDRRPQLVKRPLVRQLADALPCADAQMEAAEAADHEVGAKLRVTGAFPAGRTLPPGIRRVRRLGARSRRSRSWAGADQRAASLRSGGRQASRCGRRSRSCCWPPRLHVCSRDRRGT